jgi:hypothetical protein
MREEAMTGLRYAQREGLEKRQEVVDVDQAAGSKKIQGNSSFHFISTFPG